MKDEALKLALEALESFKEISDFTPAQAVYAITALRQAIEQAEQAQPVAIIASLMPAERNTLIEEGHSLHDALYTAPPPRKLEQEPIGEVVTAGVIRWKDKYPSLGTKLYTAPPPRQPLTDEQWQIMADTLDCFITRGQKDIIEAAHGIKG